LNRSGKPLRHAKDDPHRQPALPARVPQGLKPQSFSIFTARLKPRPVTRPFAQRGFHSAFHSAVLPKAWDTRRTARLNGLQNTFFARALRVPQRLKPQSSLDLYGAAEAAPFYKALFTAFHSALPQRSLQRPSPRFHCGLAQRRCCARRNAPGSTPLLV
jgi:hypothetical protein